MTFDIDMAIQHCHEKAKGLRAEAVSQAHNPECEECANEHEQLAEWLEELKARREADRWIPVSERLPEEYGEYLITGRYGYVGKDIYNDHFKEFNKGNTVIAWKPLPEPYKENDK